MLKKTFETTIKQEGGKRLRFIASTEAVDRDGDILSVQGWELEPYLKNPVVLWGHDRNSLPVAKTISLVKNPTLGRLEAVFEFPRDGVYPLADTIFKLASAKFISAVSVGFLPIEWVPLEAGGRKYTKQELLEISIVNIPAQAEALQLAFSRGIISKSEKSLLETKGEFDLAAIPYPGPKQKQDFFIELDHGSGVKTVLRDQDAAKFLGKLIADEIKRVRLLQKLGGY